MSRRGARESVLVDQSKFELAEGYLANARELASVRNFLGALESLTHAFSCVKDHPEAILLQACVRAAQGRPELASKELEKFSRLYPAWISNSSTLGGWLSRDRRQVVGGTQRRWFCLKDKFLFYYREPTDSTPLSGYVLENATLGQELFNDSRDLTQFSFVIPPSINYTLDAFDAKSRAEWISVLMEANLIDPFAKGTVYFPDPAAITSSAIQVNNFKDPALLEGYLSKRGGTNTDWKIRWFTLRGTLLTYHEKEGSKPLGSIDIRNCKVRQGEDEGAEFPFQLITPIRTYYIDSEHSDTTRAWIMAIFNAQEDAKKISTDGILTAPIDTAYDPGEIKRKTHHGASSSSSSKSAFISTPPSTIQHSDDSDTPRLSSSPSSSPQPSSSNQQRKTIDPAMGRKWGDSLKRGPNEQTEPGVKPLLPVSPYLGNQRHRTSALSRDSAYAVELTDFQAPDTANVALASLNEDEEIRRNQAARKAANRARFDRTQSELLNEPLLPLEADPLEKETSQGCCSQCTIS